MNKYGIHVFAISLAVLIVAPVMRIMFQFSYEIYYIPYFIILAITVMRLWKGDFRILASNQFIFYMTCLLLLVGLLTLSLNWTVIPGHHTADLFNVFIIFFLMVTVVLNWDDKLVNVCLSYLVALSAISAIYVLIISGGILGVSGYGTKINKYYLTFADINGLGFVISATYFFYQNRNQWKWLSLTVLFSLALAVSLGRGSLLFSFLTLLVAFIFVKTYNLSNKSMKKVLYKHLMLGIPVVLATFFFALQVTRTKLQLLRMLNFSVEWDRGGRGELWTTAWKNIKANPIWGHGIGSNQYLSHPTQDIYPHNLFLQIGLDVGFVGIVLLALVIFAPIHYFIRHKDINKAQFLPILLPYIYLILEYSKSFDLYKSRSIFLFSIILVLATQSNRVRTYLTKK